MSTYCVRHIAYVVLYYLISPMRWILLLLLILTDGGFPGGVVVINPPANAEDTRDTSSVPGSGRSPGGGNGSLLQYSCLENSMDRAAWWATVHGIPKSLTGLSARTRTQIEQESPEFYLLPSVLVM